MHLKGIYQILFIPIKVKEDSWTSTRPEHYQASPFPRFPRLLLFSHLCFFYQLHLQGKSLHPSTIPAQVHGFHTGGDETAELRILRQNNIIGLPAEQGGASGERVPAALALWLECLDEPHL